MEAETIITEIQNWLDKNNFEFLYPKTKTLDTIAKSLFEDFNELWHLGLAIKPEYIGSTESSDHCFFLGLEDRLQCRLTLAVLPESEENLLGQVELWLTSDDEGESYCQVNTFDYSLPNFWEDFSSAITLMARIKD